MKKMNIVFDKTSPLTPEILEYAAGELATVEPAFAQILTRFGPPPLWDRPPDFTTLVRIILEQQVSLASARAAFNNLQGNLGIVTPEGLLALDDPSLKSIGFSRQKIRYTRALAQAVIENTLKIERLEGQADITVKNELMAITGIGHWTSDIYLLMALRRPDVWPHGDRALAVAYKEVFDAAVVPDYDTLRHTAQKWAPWRSVAARFLWHHYLSTKRK